MDIYSIQWVTREEAKVCCICGMLANVDPFLHEERYGHAPVWEDDVLPEDDPERG
jgi:hypothetical protein